jgi:hypothetical protein
LHGKFYEAPTRHEYRVGSSSVVRATPFSLFDKFRFAAIL